jgi:hypothetical protein
VPEGNLLHSRAGCTVWIRKRLKRNVGKYFRERPSVLQDCSLVDLWRGIPGMAVSICVTSKFVTQTNNFLKILDLEHWSQMRSFTHEAHGHVVRSESAIPREDLAALQECGSREIIECKRNKGISRPNGEWLSE